MKPLSLEIDAFGSFADRQTIDFTALAERRLFLIHGPTGAGKSTILEAICFALYGAPSGGSELAVGTHLRSQHAASGCPTRVALEFALGAARYRVERAPRQRRESKRAKAGYVEEKPSATLWRMKADATRDDPGTPLATKPSDVDARIRELLGLDRAQFRQVILLPQGEFRKLLEASTKDREDILARLFDIDRFADVERRLKQAADGLARELAGLERDRETLLSQVGVEGEEAFALARKQLAEELAEAQKTLVERAASAEASRRALEAGRDVARRLEERRQAERALADYEARAAELDNLREREAWATRAEGPGERLDARDRSARDRDAARARLQEAIEASGEAKAAATAARNEELAHRERAPELRAFEAERATLVAARATAGELASKRRALEAGRRELEALRARIAEARTVFEGAQQAIAEADRAAAGRADAEEALRAVTARGEAVEARLTWVTQKEASDGRIAALETAMGPLRERVAAGRAEIAALEAELAEARRLDRERASARLAATLREGEPCPVCGAEEHPAPAVDATGDGDVTPAVHATGGGEETRAVDATGGGDETRAVDALEAVEERERALSEARRGLEGAAAELAALEGQHASEIRAGEALVEEGARLAERSEGTADVAALEPEGLRAEREAATAEQARIRSELDRAIAAETDREARRAALERAREALEGPTRQELTLRTTLEATQQAIESAEGRLPEAARTVEAIDARLDTLATRRDRLEAEIEGSRERAGRAEAEQVARERVEAERRAALVAAERVADEAAAALAAALVDGGFEDERALGEARMDARERVALRERIAEYDRGRAAARALAEAKRAATEDVEAVDLASLEQRAESADAARAAAQDRVGALGERQTEQDRLAETLERQRDASGRLLTRFERVKSIANVAGGDNAHRTSFQRFVLAAFLDEVLEVASHSLRRMSKGRYALVRSAGVEDRRRRGGLDLAVQDAHTGDERPAATLSGGESFCAALALALGLAEVVQRHSGGTRLDAIFVDEGFGSLDPESLELALGTLVELQSGGRLVGLISHVPELKERIETRLEVTPGRGGSQLALVAP